MSKPEFSLPEHTFRARFQRSRGLEPEAQLQECVEYLENPEILIQEFMQSFHAVESCCDRDAFSFVRGRRNAREEDLVLEHFFGSLVARVCPGEIDGGYGFTCLTGALDPLPPPLEDPGFERSGFDYVGRIAAPDDGLALGAIPSDAKETSYLRLLRLLNALAELAPAVQLERLERELTEEPLDRPVSFDLHLIEWHEPCETEPVALRQLTRDLGDVFRRGLLGLSSGPEVLRQIAGLRMDPQTFEGELLLDWVV